MNLMFPRPREKALRTSCQDSAPAASISLSRLTLPPRPALAVVDIPGKGRGVATTVPMPAGALIELAPVVPLSRGDTALIIGTALEPYLFQWDEPRGEHPPPTPTTASSPVTPCAIVLGITTLLNHSATPNARFRPDYPSGTMRLESLRPIAAGEEVTMDYECELWFEPLD